ncbi:MAG: helix-turn-helix transcriptional regulator [Alphaproteobacteria bacterium]|nr:helix-turn-helix transcriptional regulator [Alphaproteobacteria bacterium]
MIVIGDLPDRLVLGNVVAALRAEQGLTQEQLAQAVGISQPTLSRIERGASVPDVLAYRRLAEALGVTASELDQLTLDAREGVDKAISGVVGESTPATAWKRAITVAGVALVGGVVAFAVVLFVRKWMAARKDAAS